jgi:hypothetical protein
VTRTKNTRTQYPSSERGRNSGLVPYELFCAEGRDLSRLLLKYPETQETLRSLSNQDYFRLVKKADRDSLSLLALGSEAQWSYLLDIDLWDKDRFDRDRLTLWIERFGDADPERFVEWLFRDGLGLACLYFSEVLDVLILTPDDEDVEIPDGFFTFDGIVYLRPRSEESRAPLRAILDTMAQADINLFTWIITSSGGLITAETEEELYRLRNARLADEGFLPFEEALELYVPLDPASLENWSGPGAIDVSDSDNDKENTAIPGLPLAQAGPAPLFLAALDRVAAGPDMDRLRLEFAGLCNQILSAEGTWGRELDEMTAAAVKSGGYINLALDALAGDSPEAAEKTIRSHHLHALFRVGFGMVAEVARSAREWLRESWFHREGLPLSFWGENSGHLLKGLLSQRPVYYSGPEGYRDFSSNQDLESCRSDLEHLAVLDELAGRLDGRHPPDRNLLHSPGMNVQTLLITFFARKLTGTAGDSYGIPLDEARKFLDRIRQGEPGTPYALPCYETSFVSEFEDMSSRGEAGNPILRKALAAIWKEFQEEYAHVESTNLEERYAKYFIIL